MNRYRHLPGLGPQKATASTTCQKCLKKGHYSYECKASLSERPYAARPSRTQVLRNPKLGMPLERDGNGSLGTGPGEGGEGVADQVLATQEARRTEGGRRRSGSPEAEEGGGRRKVRERSISSVDSVETISTNREGSRSPAGGSTRRPLPPGKVNGTNRSPSPSTSPVPSGSRKRRRASISTASESRSPRTRSLHPDAHREYRRRYRTNSPDDRGRPHSFRRGSRRSRSGSDGASVDKSRITKQRRVLEEDEYAVGDEEGSEREKRLNTTYHSERSERSRLGGRETQNRPAGEGDAWPDASRRDHGVGRDGRWEGSLNGKGKWKGKESGGERRRERSLSPYSRRLALTQALNLGS